MTPRSSHVLRRDRRDAQAHARHVDPLARRREARRSSRSRARRGPRRDRRRPRSTRRRTGSGRPAARRPRAPRSRRRCACRSSRRRSTVMTTAASRPSSSGRRPRPSASGAWARRGRPRSRAAGRAPARPARMIAIFARFSSGVSVGEVEPERRRAGLAERVDLLTRARRGSRASPGSASRDGRSRRFVMPSREGRCPPAPSRRLVQRGALSGVELELDDRLEAVLARAGTARRPSRR